MATNPQSISSFIKEFRQMRELTLRGMADYINRDSRDGKPILSYQTILNWENGTVPAMETCYKMSKSGDPTISWLGGVLLEVLYE